MNNSEEYYCLFKLAEDGSLVFKGENVSVVCDPDTGHVFVAESVYAHKVVQKYFGNESYAISGPLKNFVVFAHGANANEYWDTKFEKFTPEQAKRVRDAHAEWSRDSFALYRKIYATEDLPDKFLWHPQKFLTAWRAAVAAYKKSQEKPPIVRVRLEHTISLGEAFGRTVGNDSLPLRVAYAELMRKKRRNRVIETPKVK